jgi:hypothetical protein
MDMSRKTPLGMAMLGLVMVALSGCSDRPPRIYPPEIDAGSAGAAAMDQYDTNGDGQVAGEELDAAPTLRVALERLDTNGDGAVSADEVAERIRAWQESRVGRMSGMCRVLYRGQPLEGATVVFDPEEFLGDDIRPATGTTDEQGMAMVSIETDPDDPNDVPGIAPGLYLVRITSERVDLPPKYNTETTLGCEMAQDNMDMETGLEFNLE